MKATQERWLPVIGYEGLYEVSDQGRVRSLGRVTNGPYGSKRRVPPRVMKPSDNGTGHQKVNLYKHNAVKQRTIHTLMMEAFVGPRPKGMFVCHWNDNPGDNRLANLRYASPSDNSRDMVRNGTSHTANRTHCPRGHSYSGLNLYVGSNGGRRCRACKRAEGVVEFRTELLPKFNEIADLKYEQILSGE